MKKLEKQYLDKNLRYHIEREILSTMKKEDLQIIMKDKSDEEKYYKERLKKYMKKLMTSPRYLSWDELERLFNEWIIYIKAWWKEYEEFKELNKQFKYLFDLKFTDKNSKTYSNISYKEVIEKVKALNIKEVVTKYTNSKINHNDSLKCPLHKDNRASFQIYWKTNSFYCYWCHIWWTPIEFTAKLFNLTNKEAINKLKDNFLYL